MKDKAFMDRGIEVFAKGFADTRSFAHTCLAKRVGKLWHVKDAPRKKGDYRREEWIGWGVPAERYRDAAEKHSITRHCVSAICPIDDPEEELKAGFKDLGYRFGMSEAFMVHELKRIPRVERPVTLKRVKSVDLADRLNTAAKVRQLLPEHLSSDSPVRQYVALEGDEPVGWVRSHDVGGATWCSNMFVKPEYRRRGIAKAMMCQMLRDDRKYGAELAVLTASKAGAELYPLVGYREIATLLFFTSERGST